MLESTQLRPRTSKRVSAPSEPRLTKSERVNRALAIIVKIGVIGGAPNCRKEREAKVQELMRTMGANRLQVEKAIDLQLDGATKGARSEVESWLSTVH